MQKVNTPLSVLRRTLLTQFVCAAKCIRPCDRRMHQESLLQIFVKLIECGATLILRQLSSHHGVAQCVSHLETVQRREEERSGGPQHVGSGCRSVCIFTD